MKNWILLSSAAVMLAACQPAQTTRTIDFGDDSSTWANDGECDDPRFAGPGMTTTTLLASDILHDATDCRAAYARGALWVL